MELKAIPWSLEFCELTKVFRKTSKINQRWASALEILLLLRCMFIFNILSNSIMAASSLFILISGSDPLDNPDHYHLLAATAIQLVRLIGCVYFHFHPEELARSLDQLDPKSLTLGTLVFPGLDMEASTICRPGSFFSWPPVCPQHALD